MKTSLHEKILSDPKVQQVSTVRGVWHTLLRLLIWSIVVLALLTGIVLLISDLLPTGIPHAPISAAPLLLIGAVYLAFQVLIGPTLLELFRALIVSTAFLLWGVDQLLPAGWAATTLGDIVITLYVIDLGWMIMERLRSTPAR